MLYVFKVNNKKHTKTPLLKSRIYQKKMACEFRKFLPTVWSQVQLMFHLYTPWKHQKFGRDSHSTHIKTHINKKSHDITLFLYPFSTLKN